MAPRVPTRSATAALHQGAHEGSIKAVGKDWGGVLGGVQFADCGHPVGDCDCAQK